MRHAGSVRVFCTSLLLTTVSAVYAAPLVPTGGPALNHVGNLVLNGSFEDHPDAGASLYYWGTGTSNIPFATPGSWTAAGSTNNYALWGKPSNVPPGGEPAPDGNVGLYFGNGTVASISQTPTYHPDGTVTFPTAPTITSTYGSPVTLTQTISGLTASANYSLSFWVTGEDAVVTPPNPGFAYDGIFGLDLTGYSTTYLTVPSGTSGLGTQHIYRFDFSPTSSSVTLTFTNWGHFFHNVTTGWISSTDDSTELILDDVIINQVPEPASLPLLGIGTGMLLLRRRGLAVLHTN